VLAPEHRDKGGWRHCSATHRGQYARREQQRLVINPGLLAAVHERRPNGRDVPRQAIQRLPSRAETARCHKAGPQRFLRPAARYRVGRPQAHLPGEHDGCRPHMPEPRVGAHPQDTTLPSAHVGFEFNWGSTPMKGGGGREPPPRLIVGSRGTVASRGRRRQRHGRRLPSQPARQHGAGEDVRPRGQEAGPSVPIDANSTWPVRSRRRSSRSSASGPGSAPSRRTRRHGVLRRPGAEDRDPPEPTHSPWPSSLRGGGTRGHGWTHRSMPSCPGGADFGSMCAPGPRGVGPYVPNPCSASGLAPFVARGCSGTCRALAEACGWPVVRGWRLRGGSKPCLREPGWVPRRPDLVVSSFQETRPMSAKSSMRSTHASMSASTIHS